MLNGQQEADGVVGEVIFPNTIRRSSPASSSSRSSQGRGVRAVSADIGAHNRWLVDFCGEFPERRAGIGQIFLNDIDEAIADVRWIKEHGLRGGILLPNIPPDVTWSGPSTTPPTTGCGG